MTPMFVLGIISGDGCFSVIFNANAEISLYFSVTQDTREVDLLYSLQSFFNCGSVSFQGKDARSWALYTIQGFNQQCEILIPFICG